jgi:hypothetical protein
MPLNQLDGITTRETPTTPENFRETFDEPTMRTDAACRALI